MNTTRPFELPGDVLADLGSRRPMLWSNPQIGMPLPPWAPSRAEILAAEMRLQRCAPLLLALFPELAAGGGEIDSALMPADTLAHAVGAHHGQWFVKRDDSIPVAGSIKARGGFHEVLALAEHIAEDHGLLRASDDRRKLALPEFRKLFSRYTIAVGSTGNLGLSIGVMAAALGFQCVVHMSADAKQWKKDRLLARGVHVVEHVGDYARAVAAGRNMAASSPRCHFVDDERSRLLFLGYAAAASQLSTQLARAGCVVSATRPLFVYIPCGVGGAPGGIVHGLKMVFGPDVHCFFAEPTASPCMLVQLASGSDRAVSVYDVGLDNRTDADGLAVGQASELAAPLMRGQLSGIFTVADEQLYANLLAAKNALNIELEPSAAAAIGGPGWLSRSVAGREYARRHDISMERATHVIWTTGGSLVPADEHSRYQRRALGTAV
ncbi:D-serine dehydratase [Burkholderia ubonensis]|uniref:Probable D-serine dehydratase n=1 Tax=Burkholderia ubonensis TaxID=101571 RepID=A0ABD4DUD6_9BURK|nr:D-serine ammonia-lyase [Burkholderia ubonensis]KVM10111.1 D-serine dehydratase [Burkholderia ubonensis]KVM12881.1 D-serine dehydratase [Burkholderia ubonensis]KVM49910.1 D-serine dehydratase [Burkholderia ubonensis]KVN76725.1 D-serine dehydratase [Burkholderia ubonensis]KVU14933.1 D-serine dehydratase [Burkholderia ubonensis]